MGEDNLFLLQRLEVRSCVTCEETPPPPLFLDRQETDTRRETLTKAYSVEIRWTRTFRVLQVQLISEGSLVPLPWTKENLHTHLIGWVISVSRQQAMMQGPITGQISFSCPIRAQIWRVLCCILTNGRTD